jgi:hypothetical protein
MIFDFTISNGIAGRAKVEIKKALDALKYQTNWRPASTFVCH